MPEIVQSLFMRLQGVMVMHLSIKPSDLYYKYARDSARKNDPGFRGKPDPAPFNRDDLYDVIPMLEQVMTELDRDDSRTLHTLEELMLLHMPRFVACREEVFDFLVGCMREMLDGR